ncbi:XRE family transcriptional regulator [Nocardioides marinquilinus]|uniref:XRE family transcriptional regulator n=1 Tax=Nocardioides marinquilinus TaxID=1210400 RepID=A0ABP9PNB1_9ACTN
MTATGASTGARIRAVRTERGLSLSALAARAGVGKATLSELEAGRRNPTLDTLYALAGPLGVPLAALVAEGDDVVGDDALTTTRLHVRHDPGRTTEVYLVRVRPGATRRSPAHAPGVREQLVVIAGEGVLETAGTTTPLAPGVHHAWAADAPHAYGCTSDVELVAVDVIVTPTGADPVD